MGLLDALLISPASQGTGLLDFLRNLGAAPGGMSGLPSDQAQYGQPAQPPMQAPMSQPAPMSAMAQAPVQMPPQTMQPQAQQLVAPQSAGVGDFFDRLNAGLQSVGSGGSFIGALTGNMTDSTSIANRKELKTQNLTAKWLGDRGYDPNTIQAAMAQPELMKVLFDEAKTKPVQSLGDGYVWDAKNNRAVRAYEPDKAPTSLGEGWVWDPKQRQAVRAYEPAEKPSTSVGDYEYYLRKLPPGATPIPFDVWTTAKAKAGAVNINNSPDFGGGSDKQIFDSFAENTKEARAAATGLTALRTARQSLQGPGGSITGFGADERLTLRKIGAAIGVADPAAIQNTETFRAAIAPQVAAMLKATVGTANISNSDREFAEKAAGGSTKLDAGTIARLLDIMERAGKARLDLHQEQLDAVYPDPAKHKRERALFGVRSPTAPDGPNIDDLVSKYGPR